MNESLAHDPAAAEISPPHPKQVEAETPKASDLGPPRAGAGQSPRPHRDKPDRQDWIDRTLDLVPIISIIAVAFVGYMVYNTVGILKAPLTLSPTNKGPTSADALLIQNQIYAELIQKQMAIRSMQITAGYVLGFVCILSGVSFCFRGIRGEVQMEASRDKINFKIQTAQVGVIVLLAGVALIALAILSPQAAVTSPRAWTGRPESSVVPEQTPIQLPTVPI